MAKKRMPLGITLRSPTSIVELCWQWLNVMLAGAAIALGIRWMMDL